MLSHARCFVHARFCGAAWHAIGELLCQIENSLPLAGVRDAAKSFDQV